MALSSPFLLVAALCALHIWSRQPWNSCRFMVFLPFPFPPSAVLPSSATEAQEVPSGDVAGSAQDVPTPEATAVAAPTDDITIGGILAKLKEFPGLGEQGASLLQLAEEGLGISASKLELGKLVPMLMELQKNVHDHYGGCLWIFDV